MSCHGCADKFGFLKKEYGCPTCGFSYCKKCLRYQVTDPKTSKPAMACVKCYQKLEKVKTEPIVVMNALHRLESMDDPAKPPITMYRQPARQMRLQELRKGLSFEDQQILERLESLKKSDAAPQSGQRRASGNTEEDIAERLAKLKGEEYIPPSERQDISFKNVKPQTEEDIIARYTEEVEMNSKYERNVVSDIEARLAKLRGDSTSQPSPDTHGGDTSVGTSSTTNLRNSEMDDLSEEDQVNLILQRLQEEVVLDSKSGHCGNQQDMEVDHENSQGETLLSEDEDDIDVDELCGICSEKRATLKCDECDGDIFCKSCFQELHRDLGEFHKAAAFKKK